MTKRVNFMIAALLTAGICLAGNVKVLNTEYAGVDIDEEGVYITVNVKMQVSNVGEEECACVALLNNTKWNSENMTVTKLESLSKSMCEGDVDIDPVTGTKTMTMAVDVPLDASLLTGKEKTFYLKTYVVDFNKNAIVSQGAMISFVPNPQEAMAQKQKGVNAANFKMATKNLGPNSNNKGKRVTVSCSQCGGSGYITDYSQNRRVTCPKCGGDGERTKIQKAPEDQNIFDILSPVLGD